ncbi:MAG: hypothetical protein HY897_10950 [Deltaproteobacteria bacterium]|nr:hypothetical protein [Deltaproteobacteria bacterium]
MAAKTIGKGRGPLPRDEVAGRPADLSQKCCALEGFTRLLSFMPGNFAVVLHSEPDCANLVFHDSRVADPSRFFCTNLKENDAIAGRGRGRLAAAVREAAARRRPDMIFVIGGCVASLASDDVDEIARTVDLPRGIRVVAVDGGAFRMYGQGAIVDWFAGEMIGAAPSSRRKKARSTNLVGFAPDGGETMRILGRVGLAVSAWPRLDSPQEAWAGLPNAALNVVSDVGLFSRLVEALETRHRVPSVEIAPPFGVEKAARLYSGIGGFFGLGAEMRAAFREERLRAGRRVSAFRRRHPRRKLAYHVGGRKDFELHTMVRGGLAFVSLFEELGFSVEVLFQGPVEEEHRRRIAALLDHHGVDAPFDCLPDRISLTRTLRCGGHSLVYCSDSLAEEAGAASVPIVPVGRLAPGFAGAEANVSLIEGLMR